MIVDAWMQHPTVRFLGHDMLASLRRWVMLAVEELNHRDALLANPLAMAQFEQLLLTGLVCGQPSVWYQTHTPSDELEQVTTSLPRESLAPTAAIFAKRSRNLRLVLSRAGPA